ncbi:MAG: hypothetical protein HOI95_09930 [Chromatiales bacterium]|jgi:hypothetical protein|nr:hypothetical protein [Chromatiales bacterium]
MHGLVQYAMRGRWNAVCVSGLCVIVPMLLDVVFGELPGLVRILASVSYLVGGAIAALAVMRNGLLEGAIVLGGALFTIGIVAAIAFDGSQEVLAIANGWVPGCLCAYVLRRYYAHGPALVCAWVIVSIIWTIMWLSADEGAYAAQASAATFELSTFQQAMLLLATVLLSAVLTLFLARLWHSRLDNPGGFGEEFRALRFPRWFAYGFAVMVVARLTLVGNAGVYFDGLMRLGLMLFIFQGLAIAHAIVKSRGGSVGWLVALYATFPMSQFILALGGFVDVFLDCRRRLGVG